MIKFLTPLVVLALVCCFMAVNAQLQTTAPKIIPPSPNATAFAKYGNIPVSTYTGVPDISIPLYEIKIRDITVPISLSYHASGIKVSEEASRVGLGWTLNAGGVISRNIVNMDDFAVSNLAYHSPTNHSSLLPIGPDTVSTSVVTYGTWMSYQIHGTGFFREMTDYVYGAHYDYEPDQYNYNFAGHSGAFSLDRARNAIVKKQEKISLVPNSSGSSWVAMTADGFKYTFAVAEYFVDYNSTGGAQQRSAWYLTEITSPQGEHVTFDYDTLSSQFIRPVGAYQQTRQDYLISCYGFPCVDNPDIWGPIGKKEYLNVYLASINWSQGKVTFEMSTRDDLEGDTRVSAVKIFRKGESVPFETYAMGHEYFSNTATSPTFGMPEVTTERLQKRLKLSSLTKMGSDGATDAKHSFGYFEEGFLRLPQKNAYARDHWGYYNGRYVSSLIPTFQFLTGTGNYNDLIGVMGNQRDPGPDFAAAFTLKCITYPTGGKTTFYYGVNDYEASLGDTQYQPQAVQSYQTVLYDGVTERGTVKTVELDLTDEFQDDDGNTISVTVNGAFRLTDPCNEFTGNANVYFELLSEDETYSWGRVDVGLPRCGPAGPGTCDSAELGCISCCDTSSSPFGIFGYKASLTLPPGKYHWKAYVNGSETRFQQISVTYNWWSDASTLPNPTYPNIKYRYGGGLRVERIEDYIPETDQVVNVRLYDYHYTTDENGDSVPEVHSYGVLMAPPVYSYFDVSQQKSLPGWGETIGGVPIPEYCTECVHVMRQSDSNIPLTGDQGNSVGYSKVIEYIGENGVLGKNEYEYENVAHIILPNNNDIGLRMRPATVSTKSNPLNGSLNKKTTYSASGEKLYQIQNTYTTQYEKLLYGLEVRQVPVKGGLQPTPYHTIMILYPALRSLFIATTSSTETNYMSNGTIASSVTKTSSYSNPDHLQLTQQTKTESDQHKTVTTYKYPADYSNTDGGAIITSMKGAKFMHSSPVEVTVMDEAQDGTKVVLDRELTIYDQFGSLVLPKEKIRLTNAEPIVSTSLATYVPSAGYDNTKYRSVYSLDYSTDGNIQKLQKTADLPVYFVWGYDHSFPVMQIQNAATNEVYYNGFEDSGTLATPSLPAGAGGRYHSGGTYTLPFTPPGGKTYKLSYKYYSGGQWNSKIVDFNASINDGSHLDEIRVYPTEAQITSYTYDAARGITSSTDANNVTSYFIYDASGRLKQINDDKGKILKTFEHHYKEQN